MAYFVVNYSLFLLTLSRSTTQNEFKFKFSLFRNLLKTEATTLKRAFGRLCIWGCRGQFHKRLTPVFFLIFFTCYSIRLQACSLEIDCSPACTGIIFTIAPAHILGWQHCQTVLRLSNISTISLIFESTSHFGCQYSSD